MGSTVHTDFVDLFKNDWFLLSDFADMFVGETIGVGCSRSVFDFNLNPNWVIKIDRSGQFDNVTEWEIWSNYKHLPEYSKFLAPCHHLSSCGRILIQQKTYPVTKEQLPTEIPDFLMDFKIQNWGMIGDRAVCHDYANHRFFNPDKIQMMKPVWWSDCYQLINENNGQSNQ